MMKQIKLAAIAAALALSSLMATTAHAITSTGGEYNSLYAGQGAKGYDVVAYFTDSKAVQGNDQFVAEYGGVTWKFARAAHRDLFKGNPTNAGPFSKRTATGLSPESAARGSRSA